MTVTTLTPQAVNDSGLNVTMASANAGGMQFANDGKTLVYIVNGDTGTPTVTATVQNKSISKPGYGPITLPDKVVTVPATGTNGGRELIGPFPTSQYNDANGNVQLTFSAVTSMTIAAVQLPTPA